MTCSFTGRSRMFGGDWILTDASRACQQRSLLAVQMQTAQPGLSQVICGGAYAKRCYPRGAGPVILRRTEDKRALTMAPRSR